MATGEAGSSGDGSVFSSGLIREPGWRVGVQTGFWFCLVFSWVLVGRCCLYSGWASLPYLNSLEMSSQTPRELHVLSCSKSSQTDFAY